MDYFECVGMEPLSKNSSHVREGIFRSAQLVVVVPQGDKLCFQEKGT